MYRLKRNAALAASYEAELEKEGQKAILFSIIASVLSIINNPDQQISIAGISINLKEQFLINGAFCALAIYFGTSTLLIILKLYGVGWPSAYGHFYKRYISRRRNRSINDIYSPRRVKREVKIICFFLNSLLFVLGVLLSAIYSYGVIATFPDLLKILMLLLGKFWMF